SLERREEARPSCAALKLAAGHEERLIATRARERADALLVQQRARPGPLGAVVAQHRVLLRGQLRAPLGIGLFNRKGLVGHSLIISILGGAPTGAPLR